MERKSEETTLVRVYEMTPNEEKALQILRKRATQKPLLAGIPWADEKEFRPLTDPLYRTKDGLAITLNASIDKVEQVLAKALNPKGRQLFSAAKFSDGTIERIHREPDGEGGSKVLPKELAGYRDNAKEEGDDDVTPSEIVDPKDIPKAKSKPAKPAKAKKEPIAAATAKQPVIGCPMPEFPEADIRATRALIAFLDEDQIRDYRRHGAFVTTGRDTGHRYMICNREAPVTVRMKFPNAVGGYSASGLYDLDEERPLCVHDWDVPPPEEMLALHLCLSIPGYEHYVRSLPHAFQ